MTSGNSTLATPWTVGRAARFARDFGWLQLKSLVFAGALFVAIALSAVVPLPIPRYDALLIFGLALTFVLWKVGWESGREVAVIFAFHVMGVGLEIFKVRMGSWSYPGEGWSVVAGVPLYSGFMYAAVGSYICQAWRRFDLRVTGYKALPLTVLAVAAYANFFTHHYWVDVRWVIAALFLAQTFRTRVHFTVGGQRYHMPLAAAFVLIGSALWVAENAGTMLGAWKYPNQIDVWTLVHVGKLGSWSLLVTLSFVLIATVKAAEGRLYGHPGDKPSVSRNGAEASGSDATTRGNEAATRG